MTKSKLVSYFIALIWIINGFICKLLNLVPRHQEIVSEILGNEHSDLFTKLIGLLELGIAVWIISGFKSRLNSIIQITVIALMNTLEFILVPDLLLWGKWIGID